MGGTHQCRLWRQRPEVARRVPCVGDAAKKYSPSDGKGWRRVWRCSSSKDLERGSPKQEWQWRFWLGSRKTKSLAGCGRGNSKSVEVRCKGSSGTCFGTRGCGRSSTERTERRGWAPPKLREKTAFPGFLCKRGGMDEEGRGSVRGHDGVRRSSPERRHELGEAR